MVNALINPFPILLDDRSLFFGDFHRFSGSYSEIFNKFLPTESLVLFLHNENQAEDYFKDSSSLHELMTLFRTAQEGVQPCVIHAECLMLSFAIKDGKAVVAIVTGADPVFLRKVREDWLIDTRAAVEREFLLLKQARVDAQTGLLNLSNLYYLLDKYGSTGGLHLILLELPSRRNTFLDGLRHSKKCSSALQTFARGDSVLHYLGQNTFALILRNIDEEKQAEIESGLVTYLKREGCHRVHIGSSISRKVDEMDRGSSDNRLLDEAWTALRHAAKRGPFSFCDYSLLAHPEIHPLAPPERKLVRKMNRMAAGSDSFSLVQFRSDEESHAASSFVLPLVDRGVIVTADDDLFVYLEGVDGKSALQWANDVISGVDNFRKDIHISAGISSYPFSDFKKSELVANCRKALLHAAFFGKSSAVLFDAISLNISGDIYYGDGDLVKAGKEYRRGLACDNQNVNLHNSLGVALVMMNKLTPAMQSFETGLAIESDNFMALYNLGLAEQARSRKKEAFAYLEKALAQYSDEEGGTELADDLKLQLGILSCEIGRYDKALGYLVPWQGDNLGKPRAGRVYYYLGKAYHGLSKNQKAMENLQRALRFDELDDRAIHLLGRTYLEEGEGNEIALSLCQKSVEMEPANICYRLHLAAAQVQCGMWQEAKENLYRCLRNSSCKVEAQLLLGQSYMQEGQYRRAGNWFKKVMAGKKVRQELSRQAKDGLAKILRK